MIQPDNQFEIEQLKKINEGLTKKMESIMNEPKSVGNLASALSKAQGQMTGAKKDKENSFFKSSYADMASVVAAIREPFSDNGLSVTQTMDVLDSGRSILRTSLMHVDGEIITSKMVIPEESNPQKLGSLITYYRRYMLMAICNLAPVEDDANSATLISPKLVAQLEAMTKNYPVIKEKMLANCNGNFHNITLDRFPGAVQYINELISEAKNV